MKPKITIITASWNSDKTIRDTIESVLNQTYPNIEYIIVDGGSKDNTIDIIQEYSESFEGRLKWISEPDKGIYDAMNKGIEMATGEIVGILNSDDFFTDEYVIRDVANSIEGVDAVYGDIHFVHPNDLKKSTRYYSSRKFKRWKMRFGFMPAHPSFYCRKEIFNKLGYYDISFTSAADFELLLNFIFIHNITTRYIPRDFVTMREGGISSAGMKSYIRTNRQTMNALKKYSVCSNYIFLTYKLVYKFFEKLLNKA